jgi:SAM-dependent methyltransferase
MNVRVPQTQSITGYYVNIHRDWAWETPENQACLDAVLEALPAEKWQGKRVLVLGAGSGRLAYDLHRVATPALTVATDINPLMLIAAKRIFKGKNLKLYEFPLAPKDLEHHAVLRKCVAEAPAAPGLEVLFADALTPPFLPKSFDVVLTPWLIDILPPSLPLLAARINGLLKPEGVFVNFGSLGFNHARAADNLSFEEVMATVAAAGFTVGEPKRRSIPYMQSPASAHGRIELVTTFAATKTSDVASPAAPYEFLPDWLTKRDVPVPRLKTFDAFATINTILLSTVGLIDGKRTLSDIAQAFATRHGLAVAEAEASVKGFLIRHFEQNQQGRQH